MIYFILYFVGVFVMAVFLEYHQKDEDANLPAAFLFPLTLLFALFILLFVIAPKKIVDWLHNEN